MSQDSQGQGTENGDVVLKISASKDPGYTKKVAGAMSWRLRESGFFKARAVKTEAVNTATKAVAIVNEWVLPVGVTLSMDLTFSPADDAKGQDGQDATAIAMTVQDVSDVPRPGEFVDYKVSGKQSEEDLIPRLAGAIAAPARHGKGVRLRCIGPKAVYRAVMACTIAKGYICPNGMDAIVIPTWDSLPQPDDKPPVSLIQLDFWGKKTSD